MTDIDYYEHTAQQIREAKAVEEGLADIRAGKTVDGDTAISNIRSKYGICKEGNVSVVSKDFLRRNQEAYDALSKS